MRTGISITLSSADRKRLQTIVKDRNAGQKHVWRAGIVLLSADGVDTNEIMRQTGTSKTRVWRWQTRFMEEGVDGLLRDKTGTSRVRPLGQDVAERIVALTQQDPPCEGTHWTGAMMAKAVGVSVSSVQRIWRAHGLQPHCLRLFKLSNDQDFVAKLRDVFRSIVDLQAAIHRFLEEHNKQSKPFTWTADPNKIIATETRASSVIFDPLGRKLINVLVGIPESFAA
jgi:transposase